MSRNIISLKDKSVLVTGGAGFIGSHVVDELVKQGLSNLVVVDNLFLGKLDNIKQAQANFSELKFFKINATNISRMRSILQKEQVDVIFDLAIIPLPASFERPLWVWQENIRIAETLCELLVKKEYETLIHFSSSEAYGSAVTNTPMAETHPLNPSTPYAASKAATDALIFSYVKTFGIDASILRPFNNYGPRQNEGSYAGIIPIVIKRILDGKSPVIFGDGRQTRDYIYVTDTARSAITIYNNPVTRGRVLNIASGVEISILKLVETISQQMGFNGEILYDKPRLGDVRHHWADISLADELIDFKTNIKFDEGIKMTVDWYNQMYFSKREFNAK
jgi:UDP-glucose 4-epimerase